MPIRLFATLLLLLGLPCAALGVGLDSVSPGRGVPGTGVMIVGGPFSAGSEIFLGAVPVAPDQVRSKLLAFTVPQLPPGTYTLVVMDGDEVSRQTFPFEVLEPRPVIEAIYPRNLDSCAEGGARQVEVEGSGFLPGAVVLVNEVVEPLVASGSNRLAFELPGVLQAGVYGVQVRNPGGEASLPQSLWVNTIPEIYAVERGADFVNHYEIVIRGKNFLFGSILVVNQPESEFPDIAHRPLTLRSYGEARDRQQELKPPQADRLIFRDCQTLVYYRYPTSTQERDLVFQVINPDGHKSGPVSAFLP